MIAVLICGLINSGLLIGLVAGIVTGFVGARVEIAAALAYDPLGRGIIAMRPGMALA